MSSYTSVHDEKQVEVLIGWESKKRNILTQEWVGGGFFMVVYDAEHPRATSDRPAFSNLDSDNPNPYPLSLVGYLELLRERWGVTLPPQLIDQLEDDRRNDR